jgi:hypothetical protein
MIHDNIYRTSDTATGIPTGTSAPVVFTANAVGTDYARSVAPFNGVCNVCHTVSVHYGSNFGDGHNAATRCTNCHLHNGFDQVSAFTPTGNCDTCHGYPPASPGFTGTQNNWSSARAENYVGAGGAHTVASHVSKTASPANGFAECVNCHTQSDHRMSAMTFLPSSNIKVNPKQRLHFAPGSQARYTSNRLDGAAHKTGTCSNISCHFGTTPKWDLAN